MSVGSSLSIPHTSPHAHATGAIVPRAGSIAPSRVAASYAECARITRSRARNFYHGLRLTPEPRRGAIYSIYAWMRTADDEADTPQSPAEQHERLARFRQMSEQVLAGQQPGDDWPLFWPAFAATVWSYPLDPSIFRDMLAGLDEDLDHAAYATDAELSRYCYRVAGTAGLACVRVWGLREGADTNRVAELALRRGQAFQRTNILRDFAQDYDALPRRVYLPTQALEAAGLSAQQLRDWGDPQRCRDLIADQAAIAREHYTASESLLEMIDPDCAPTLWAMTRIYSGILNIIERDPRAVVGTSRIRLSGIEKASIALRAAAKAKVSGW